MAFNPVDQFYQFFDSFEILGRGQYAVVRRCVEKKTEKEYAVKVIKKRRNPHSRRGAKRTDIEREVKILQELGHHDNIIYLHSAYENSSEIFLVLEYVSGGELFHHVCSKERLGEDEAADFIRQILYGVAHLHCRFIAHLDLKPENILLKRNGSKEVKIIDFGLSRKIRPTESVKDMVGTPEFVAPEVIEYADLSIATDMWAIGVITYILLSGMSPFMGDSRDATFSNITAVNYFFDDHYFHNISNEAKDFIGSLLVREVRKRATCTQCLRHPWITRSASLNDLMNRVNMNGFAKKHSVHRKWKIAILAVQAANRFSSCSTGSSSFDSNLNQGNGHCKVPNGKTNRSSSTNRFQEECDLLDACESCDLERMKNLIDKNNVALHSRNEFGQTCMHIAAACGYLNIVKFLYTLGDSLASIDEQHKETPLFFACRSGQSDIVDFLLKEGASVKCKNDRDETALFSAVRFGHTDVVSLLLNFNADPNAQNKFNETPAMLACENNFPAILKLLIHAKANIVLKTQDCKQAIHFAASSGSVECLAFLLNNNQNLDLNVADSYGQTPLHLAVLNHNFDAAVLLIHFNCDIDAKDSHSNSPLHLACQEGQLDLVDVLCRKKCNVDVVNKDSSTALHIAVEKSDFEIVKCLCLAGANLSIKNAQNQTTENLAQINNDSLITDLLSRLRNDSIRRSFIDQITQENQLIRRIKVKFIGNSGCGKSALVESLKTTLFGSLFRRKSEVLSRENSLLNGFSDGQSNIPTTHVYTKGIDVQQVSINGCGDLSIWDFGCHPRYQMVYDHFIGNADCIHTILFRVTDPTEKQYQQVVYWMNFLKARIVPSEPVGFKGSSFKPAYVILIGTFADMLNDDRSAASNFMDRDDGFWSSCEADAMLKTLMHRFGTDFRIHHKILIVDAQQPNCHGLKLLKSYLAGVKQDIVQALSKSNALLDATLTYLQNLKKSQPETMMLSWPELLAVIQKEINPLASEIHVRKVLHQLQLMGEIVYVKGDTADSDLVVINPQWLTRSVIGAFLAPDLPPRRRGSGRVTSQDWPNAVDTITDPLQPAGALQLLLALGLGATLPNAELEAPSLVEVEAPDPPWSLMRGATPNEPFTYGGVRLAPPRGMDGMLNVLFARVQSQLRRSVMDLDELTIVDLINYKNCIKMVSDQLEAVIRTQGRDAQSTIDVLVRGPTSHSAACFYFREDLACLVEQAVVDVAPGLPLERHYLSPKCLSLNSHSPTVYHPWDIVQTQMQQLESPSTTPSNQSATGSLFYNQALNEDIFLDAVCMGCREASTCLTPGVALTISQLPPHARRELAALLDGQEDAMGRDWSILAARLGLARDLPRVTNGAASENGDANDAGSDPRRHSSPTIQVLDEWEVRWPEKATVATLLQHFTEMDRKDVLGAVMKCIPAYVIVTQYGTVTNTETNSRI